MVTDAQVRALRLERVYNAAKRVVARYPFTDDLDKLMRPLAVELAGVVELDDDA